MSKREIKFRAWDGKEMDNFGEYLYWFEEQGIRDIDHMGWKIMQYTGLKDKTGKEIYEGDIILAKHLGENVTYKVYINPVTQQQGIESTDEHGDLQGLYDYHFDCQVIGNIYENPELLTK